MDPAGGLTERLDGSTVLQLRRSARGRAPPGGRGNSAEPAGPRPRVSREQRTPALAGKGRGGAGVVLGPCPGPESTSAPFPSERIGSAGGRGRAGGGLKPQSAPEVDRIAEGGQSRPAAGRRSERRASGRESAAADR